MIRCPKCGSTNRDGRRTCESCGAVLPQTKVRCPRCGALNPVGHIFCDSCNTRLIETQGVVPPDVARGPQGEQEPAPLKGISLPTRSSEQDASADASELPDWLLGLQDEAAQSLGAEDDVTPDRQSEISSEDEDAYPDWLSELLDEDTDLDDVDLGAISFSGVAQDDAEQPSTAEDQADDESEAPLAPAELPDRLRAVDAETPTQKSTPTLEATESSAPWTDQPYEVPSEESAPPDRLDDAGADTSSDLPTWLAAMAEEETESTPEAWQQEPASLPDWLKGPEVPDSMFADRSRNEFEEDDRATDDEGARDLPDWLDAEQEPDEAVSAEARWWEIEADDEDTGKEVEEEAEAFELFEDEVPDWFSDVESLSSEEGGGYEEAASDEGASDEGASDEGASDEGAPEEESEEPTAWLNELPDAASFDEAPSVSFTDEELPDWIADVRRASEAEESGVVEPQAESTAQEPERETPVIDGEDVDPDSNLETLPDWLAGVDSDASEEEEEVSASVFTEPAGDQNRPPTEPEASSSEADDLPEWLKDIAPRAEEDQVEESAPAFFDDETTSAVSETTESLSTDVEVPSWLEDLEIAPTEPSPIIDRETLARAELPAWLQELAPPDSGAGGEGATAAEDLVPADIPDWLQALRPDSSGEARTEGLAGRGPTTPAEPEGPLEGLPGVLASMAAVDMPGGVTPTLRCDIPDSVVEQAQLWQELLERPRSAQRPVTQDRSEQAGSHAVVRVLVALVLIVGVAVALYFLPFLIPEGMRLAVAPPVTVAEGVPLLIERMDQLDADDEVILAVEYDAAYAGEMEQVVLPVLEHLSDRGARVVIVSSLPEGVTLGTSLWAQVSDAPVTAPVDYLVGNASGIASFLADPTIQQSADHLLVLASRSQRLRWWIEQNRALINGDGVDPLPTSVVVSAAAGPFVAPYLEESRIEGWVVGFPQAVTYHNVRGTEDLGYTLTLDVLMLAHWAAAGFVLLGLLYYLVAGKKGRR